MSRPRLLIVLRSTCSLLVLCWASARAFQARPLAQRTYSWIAELVATDTTAKTITVKARIPEYIAKYTDRFKPGDHITLIWNMLHPPEPPSAAASEKDVAKPSAAGGTPAPAAPIAPPTVVLKTESDLLMSIDSSDATRGTKLDTGFILPAEFVSAEAKTVTLKLHVADTTLRAVASMPPRYVAARDLADDSTDGSRRHFGGDDNESAAGRSRYEIVVARSAQRLEDMSMTVTTAKETLGFQAEVKQLLHLMVHSLYGNKEIFLRELISNASDACDRLRFEHMAHGVPIEEDTGFQIRVSYDATARTVMIADNGIGLSRQEVIDHIGTIAKSGTREFFQRLTADAAKDAQLIGQFGVGFYSAFIVAERVTLVTGRAGTAADDGVRWESTGEGAYTVETVAKGTRGTDVTLHLRAGEDDLLSGRRLREIIRKYSDHISFPILMKKEQWDSAKKAHVLTDADEQVNAASALWARPKSEITREHYKELYKHVGHDFEPPLAWAHAKVEGRQEFTQLFYIPRRAPFDLWDPDRRHRVKLYVRRVFIMDSAEQLLPVYLRFVRGIIDSSDLPLDMSREILQQSPDVAQIRAASIKRMT